MKVTGTLYTISAPSGGGKTSLVQGVLQQIPQILMSVSHTTRGMRPGEKDKIDYCFIDTLTFQAMLERGEFLEHAEVFDNFYGTSKSWIEKQVANGKDVILELDWQGARQVRNIYPGSISIFILPPSKAILLQRLKERAQDDEQTIERRMAKASAEMSHCDEYDYIIINDDFQRALNELKTIILANRLRLQYQTAKNEKLIQALLV